MRRGLEPESDRVADVQVAHATAAGFDPLRLDDDVPDRVGEPVETGSNGDRRGDFRGGHGTYYRGCIA